MDVGKVVYFMMFCLYYTKQKNLFCLAKAINSLDLVNVYDKKHCELYANNERGYVLFSGNKEENMHPSCNLSLFYM